MRENDLLAHIFERSRGLPAPIVIGPGDDAALLRLPAAAGTPGSAAADVLVTTDQVIEGRHYGPASTSIDLIARKAVARSVSDIAAMGGRPLCGFATAALRRGFRDADALFDALSRFSRAWGCPLAGGDIASVDGPTVLTVTILGAPHPVRGAVLRSGARPGDGVYVTGRIGGSLASGRHLTFEPRVAEGEWLCDSLGGNLTAMIDVSDGLGRDASRIGDMSGVLLEIDADSIPLHADVASWRDAVAAGEDYELLFTASEPPATISPGGTPVRRIGSVVAGARHGAVIVTKAGERIDAHDLGHEHRDE